MFCCVLALNLIKQRGQGVNTVCCVCCVIEINRRERKMNKTVIESSMSAMDTLEDARLLAQAEGITLDQALKVLSVVEFEVINERLGIIASHIDGGLEGIRQSLINIAAK